MLCSHLRSHHQSIYYYLRFSPRGVLEFVELYYNNIIVGTHERMRKKIVQGFTLLRLVLFRLCIDCKERQIYLKCALADYMHIPKH